MSNFQRISIILFLCIAVILFTGILVSKYLVLYQLSTQILELRKELDPHSSQSKYGLQANLVPVAQKRTQNKSIDPIPNQNSEELPSMFNNFAQSPVKVKRSKRHAVSDDEHFRWNFNFNLTGQRNHALQESSEISSTSHHDKHLDIALFTEGEAKKMSAFDEIQHSLRAVEYFFKYLFTSNITDDETKNEFSRVDMDSAENGSGNLPMRGREGKFFDLRKIFGFRISPERSVSSSTSTAPETAFKRDDLVATQSPAFDITENSQEMQNFSNFQAQSLVFEALNVANKSSSSESSLPGKNEDGDCLDCDAIGLETLEINESIVTAKSVESIATGSTEFTDEFLEMFCMSLVNKVGVSQHLSDSDELSLEPKQNIIDEHDILRSPENSDPDLIQSSISEKELNPEFVAGTFVKTNDTLISENEIRQKFLSFSSLLGFGSGRSAADKDESELTSEKFANIDLSNLPTLLDCENYFRNTNLKMFPKPNFMDIISDPKIQFSDFANATISPNLIEQQLQFLTSLLKSKLDNNLETFGKNSDGVVTKSVSDEIAPGSDSTLNVVPEEILMHTGPNDLSGSTKILSTSTDVDAASKSTELERDGRLIGIFGFGSGNGESRSLGTENFDRNEILVRGDETKSTDRDINEFGSGDSRSFWPALFGTNKEEFGSGDSRSFWPALFGTNKEEFGSGDSRSLETVEFGINENELGSGNVKSLDAAAFGVDKTEIGSGDSQIPWPNLFGADRNESGNDDQRSLVSPTLGTETDEFGSGHLRFFEKISGNGDSRSLEDVTFRPVTNEFGSGNSRSLESVLFGDQINEFGSGDSRSFTDEISGIERSEFGSGDSFKETLDFVTKTREDLRSISSNKHRFWGMLGLAGSGDGRGLSENVNVSQSEKNCENCSSEVSLLQQYDCENDECKSKNANISDVNLFEDHDLVERCRGECLDSVSFKNETIESETNSSDMQYCQKCNLENIGETNASSTAGNKVVSGCDECNSTTLHSEDSKQILPIEKLAVIDINQATENTYLETNSNGTSVDSKANPSTEENASDTQSVSGESKERTTEKNDQRFLGPIFLTGSGDGGLFGDSGGPINLIKEDESSSAKTRDDDTDEKDMDSKVEISFKEFKHEQTTEISSQRFFGQTFLTGSGDGGLFEDRRGPINILSEDSTITSQIFFDRKARLDDSPQTFSEVLRKNSLKQSDQEPTVDGNTTKEKLTSPVIPSRRGRMEDTTDEHCDDCDYDYEDFIENYRKQINLTKDPSKFEKRTNAESDWKIPVSNKSVTVTALPDIIRSNISVFPDLTKVSRFQARPCTAARECNVTLNERCISINSSRVCGCSKGYARNKETRKCIVMKIVETSIKLPAETFQEDLKNPLSPGFQQKMKSAVELVMLLLQDDPGLLRILSDIGVEFSAGSLVVKLNLVFATENKSQEQLIKHVEDDFQIALRNETLMRSASLDVSEASLISVNGEIDYCKSSVLNYCSENAYCVSNSALPSYACRCKEHYRDESFDPSRVGETCIEICPKEYCGSYGHCEVLANDERICLCTGLYFGRRCEVPGLYVLIALGFVAFVCITMLLLVIFRRKCSRFSYGEAQAHGTEETGLHSHVKDRVSDAIALEENIGTMKFASISTPVPHPAITITRPSITESGSSYEFDSTFDSTPSTQKVEEDSAV